MIIKITMRTYTVRTLWIIKAARTVVIEEAMSSILAVIQLTITAVTM